MTHEGRRKHIYVLPHAQLATLERSMGVFEHNMSSADVSDAKDKNWICPTTGVFRAEWSVRAHQASWLVAFIRPAGNGRVYTTRCARARAMHELGQRLGRRVRRGRADSKYGHVVLVSSLEGWSGWWNLKE